MKTDKKLSVFLPIAGYALVAGLLLYFHSFKNEVQFSELSALALVAATVLGFTIVPWLAARQCLVKTDAPSISKTALIAFSVSAAGLAFAVLMALLGNAPGFTCHIVQGIHVVILCLSGAAFLRASEKGTILLRVVSILYFISSWFMPQFAASLQCGGDCTQEGWKFLTLSLFDLNIIVSAFMGFFVWRAARKIREKG